METEEQRRARRAKDQQTYGCIFILALAIGAILVFWLAFGPNGFVLDRASGAKPIAETPVEQLRRRINAGPITAAEQRRVEAALNERYPQGSRVLSSTSFYFDAGATSCGHIRARGTGPILRYVYRNDFAMIEGDMTPSEFTPFWQICEAGGAF